MRLCQGMTFDEDLAKAVDRVSKQLHTSRSAFTRKALREALDRHGLEQLERKHRQGYKRHLVFATGFSAWKLSGHGVTRENRIIDRSVASVKDGWC